MWTRRSKKTIHGAQPSSSIAACSSSAVRIHARGAIPPRIVLVMPRGPTSDNHWLRLLCGDLHPVRQLSSPTNIRKELNHDMKILLLSPALPIIRGRLLELYTFECVGSRRCQMLI